ncbi:hypothetical protein E5D57_003821 [Metarhizium anisopliae]|nr:hypothetical protein E5D57_003821 [Metarhizium anisopliae]
MVLIPSTSRKRRVKCDEGKPTCFKCMSARKPCEGYAAAVRFVHDQRRIPRQEIRSQTRHFRNSFTRSISSGVGSTHMERQFFCSYRRATEAGVSMHSCGVSPFWTTLAPQLGHCDEAVQHALVALGAAYHLYKVGKGASSHLQVSSPAVGTLERFTWREYNLAIRNLHRHLDKPEPASIAVVLVSCLAFISLELLRGDHYTAIAHMRNGIRILMSALDVRRLRAAASRRRARGSFLSDADLWDIVTQFRNVEFALGGFSSDIPLLLGQQLRGDTPDARPIASVAQGYDARTQYVNEVMVRCWDLREHRGSQVFWAQPHMQEELNTLRQRGVAIMSALELLWAGPQAPPMGTWLSYSSQMDWLLVNSARTMIQLVPFGIDSHLKMAQDPCFQDELSRGVSFAAKMLLAHNLEGKPPSDYTLETGLIALMYWSYVYSTRLGTKEAALRILQESTQREGPWDASLGLRFLSRDTKPRLLISFWRDSQAITHPAIPWQLRVVEH